MPGNKQLLDANKLFLSIPFSFASGAAVNSFSASRGLLLLLLLSHFSRVQLCATPETAAHQAPPSLGFSRQEHWSGLPFPSPMCESEKWKWSRSVGSGLFTTPWTAAYQAPPSMGFSRQEYWSGVPLPSPKQRGYFVPNFRTEREHFKEQKVPSSIPWLSGGTYLKNSVTNKTYELVCG